MSFGALCELIKKDLKIFFRSKVSSVVVVLIPLLIVLFAGYAFDSSGLSDVQVGVYSDSYTDFTNSIISDFGSEGFSSNNYPSKESCIDSVKHSESQICILFPSGLSSDVSSDEIVFYADYSRMNLADNLISKIKDNVFIKTSGVGEDIAQGLIDSLDDVKKTLPESKSKIDSALQGVIYNKNVSSNLDDPASKMSSIISDLEDIKDDVNGSGLKSEIDSVILLLEEIESKSDSIFSDLNSLSDGQGEVILRLNSASSILNNVIVTLNSGRSLSAGNIVSPIKTRIESVSADYNNSDYMIPIVLSLIALFGSILLSSTFVLKGKKTKAFFRNFMTPTKDIVFVLATYLTCLIILFIQFLLVFVGLKYVLGMDVLSMILPLLVVLILSLSVFISIGMFIGYLFRSEETIIFSSMIFASLMMFFSNIILPLENISADLIRFLKFNPLVVSNLALKKVLLFDLGFNAIKNELFILGGFFVVFFILSYLFRRLTRRVL